MSDQVSVVARFTARPDRIDKLKAELLALVPLTRAEPGCINYDLHQSPANPAEFVFYENFADAEAFAFHGAQPYIARVKEFAAELCVSPPIVTTWTMISDKA
ncbi:MAG: antibiotic biosynthesis monooxygenase [Phycisphaera sp.]|nr:antibiotic biosynthesis monooxygenase [Phycisphaera sp.]